MGASAEARVRAHAIFHGSGNTASDETIARQLEREGLGSFTRQCVGVWRRRGRWVEVAPRARQIAQLGDELREAIQVRTPDDLDRVEQASIAMAMMGRRMMATGERLAEHVLGQLGNVKIETRDDLETVIRSLAGPFDEAALERFIAVSKRINGESLAIINASRYEWRLLTKTELHRLDELHLQHELAIAALQRTRASSN